MGRLLHTTISVAAAATVLISGFGDLVSAETGAGYIGDLFSNGKLLGGSIQSESVTAAKLQDNSVNATAIAPSSVNASKVNSQIQRAIINGGCLFGVNEIRADGTVICAVPTAPSGPSGLACTLSDGSSLTHGSTQTYSVTSVVGGTDPVDPDFSLTVNCDNTADPVTCQSEMNNLINSGKSQCTPTGNGTYDCSDSGLPVDNTNICTGNFRFGSCRAFGEGGSAGTPGSTVCSEIVVKCNNGTLEGGPIPAGAVKGNCPSSCTDTCATTGAKCGQTICSGAITCGSATDAGCVTLPPPPVCTDTCATTGAKCGQTICSGTITCGSATDAGCVPPTDGYGTCGATAGTCGAGSTLYGSVSTSGTGDQTWHCYLDGTSSGYKSQHTTPNCLISACAPTQTYVTDHLACVGADGKEYGSCSAEGASCSYTAYMAPIFKNSLFASLDTMPFAYVSVLGDSIIPQAEAMCAAGNDDSFPGCSEGLKETCRPCTDGSLLCNCAPCAKCTYGYTNPGVDCSCNPAPTTGICKKIAGRCADRVTGSCGSANGVPTTTKPIANLCDTSGTTPSATGTGPWEWTCMGLYGGDTVTCSAPKKVVFPKCSCIYHQEDVSNCASGAWWDCSDGSTGGCDGEAPTCRNTCVDACTAPDDVASCKGMDGSTKCFSGYPFGWSKPGDLGCQDMPGFYAGCGAR